MPTRLEHLTKGATVRGIHPHQNVTVVEINWFSSDAAELIYREADGRLGSILLYRDQEATLDIVENSLP